MKTNSDTSAEALATIKEDLPKWFGTARAYARRIRRHDMAAVRRSIAKGRTDELVKEEPAE